MSEAIWVFGILNLIALFLQKTLARIAGCFLNIYIYCSAFYINSWNKFLENTEKFKLVILAEINWSKNVKEIHL